MNLKTRLGMRIGATMLAVGNIQMFDILIHDRIHGFIALEYWWLYLLVYATTMAFVMIYLSDRRVRNFVNSGLVFIPKIIVKWVKCHIG